MKYEIPKEIKSKPKLMGLEMKELAIIMAISFFLLTVIKDAVHSVFMVLYFLTSILGMIYLFLPSMNNPQKRNYQSIILLLKTKRGSYHSVSYRPIDKERLKEGVNEDGTFKID